MQPKTHITLRQLQQQVKKTLTEQFALPIWVSAEISDLKVNYSGHCYLELIEKGTDNQVPSAQARAVIWRSQYPQIASYFEAETQQKLASGIAILAKVLVNYHELYGFSLQIIDIDPSFTLGEVERRRNQTILQLQKEGVWDMNHELSLPTLVQRIAVISSRNAAGYQDFCKELSQSGYRFQLTLFDAFMQGNAAEDSIIEKLYDVARQLEEFDALVLIRGGGSRSDLNCFDSYRLCNHIAQFPLPVVTGIGHDKDVSVADMVAHTSLKTPTAVAGFLVERMAQNYEQIEHAALCLRDLTRKTLHSSHLSLSHISSEVNHLSRTLIARHQSRMIHLTELIPTTVHHLCQRHRDRMTANEQQLRYSVRNLLRHKQQQILSAEELIESRHPKQILRLGFAIVRTPSSDIASAQSLNRGDQVEIELSDGSIQATVNNKKIWQKKN